MHEARRELEAAGGEGRVRGKKCVPGRGGASFQKPGESEDMASQDLQSTDRKQGGSWSELLSDVTGW